MKINQTNNNHGNFSIYVNDVKVENVESLQERKKAFFNYNAPIDKEKKSFPPLMVPDRLPDDMSVEDFRELVKDKRYPIDFWVEIRPKVEENNTNE